MLIFAGVYSKTCKSPSYYISVDASTVCTLAWSLEKWCRKWRDCNKLHESQIHISEKSWKSWSLCSRIICGCLEPAKIISQPVMEREVPLKAEGWVCSPFTWECLHSVKDNGNRESCFQLQDFAVQGFLLLSLLNFIPLFLVETEVLSRHLHFHPYIFW